MTTYAPGVPPQNRNPQSIGFLLLDNFTLISLASAVEPLRMANQLSGRELYRWHTLSLDGRQVWASDGLQITPDAGTDNAPAVDCVIVCGGVGSAASPASTSLSSRPRPARVGASARCAPAVGRWPAPACSTATIAACTGNAWRRCRKPSPGWP